MSRCSTVATDTGVAGIATAGGLLAAAPLLRRMK
jgi:uncharacterized protein (TIGR03382 family)